MRSAVRLKATEGAAIPFTGAAAGSSRVFFMKKQLSRTVRRAPTGFAGVITFAPGFTLMTALDAALG